MSMFAQINATTIAPSRMPALPDTVCKNARSGAARFRAHPVRTATAERTTKACRTDC